MYIVYKRKNASWLRASVPRGGANIKELKEVRGSCKDTVILAGAIAK